MQSNRTYRLDGSINKRSAEGAVFLLRQGYDVHFEVYSDAFMHEFLSEEDYAFWLKKKAEREEVAHEA